MTLKKKILVIGATGTVGSSLTAALVAQGHTPLAATRSPEAHTLEGAQAVRLDLSDPSTFAPALEGVTRLFLLVPPGHADAKSFLDPFLKVALNSPSLERVVTMTAQGVHFDDAIPMRQIELAVEASGKPFVHLRPSWFSQNFHTFWGHGVRGADTLALPAKDATVAFIDARDIAASAAGALTRDDITLNTAYELTGPEALTHAQAAAILSEATGRQITYQDISEDAFRAQLKPSGMPDDYIELLVNLFGAVRQGVASGVNDHVERLSGQPARALSVYAHDYRDALKPL